MWSYSSWIYNYLCNQYLSPLKLWVWILFMARCTRYNIMWNCQWLVSGWWCSPGTLVSSTHKTDCHNIAEIFLKVALNTITLSLLPLSNFVCWLITMCRFRYSDGSLHANPLAWHLGQVKLDSDKWKLWKNLFE